MKPPESPGEGFLRSLTHEKTAGGLVTPNARDTLVHVHPIHLPSPREGETPVAFPGPLAGSFFVPTLTTLVYTTVIYIHGGLMIQTLGVIEGGRGAKHKPSCDASLDCPWIHLPLYKGDPRALICRPSFLFLLQSRSISQGLGTQFIPISRGAIAPGTQGPASHSSPLTWKAKLTVAG